jgi:hypothetical protein
MAHYVVGIFFLQAEGFLLLFRLGSPAEPRSLEPSFIPYFGRILGGVATGCHPTGLFGKTDGYLNADGNQSCQTRPYGQQTPVIGAGDHLYNNPIGKVQKLNTSAARR